VSKPKKFVKGGRLYVDVHDVIDDPVKLDALLVEIADKLYGIVPSTPAKGATEAVASKPQPHHKASKSPEDEFGLRDITDKELVGRFNSDVGQTGWVGARGRFHRDLCLEFDRRGIDFSCVGKTDAYLSVKRKVRLVGKKLEILPGQKKLPAE
jgi:hypothetical protein